jgi:hypothetical protein
MHQNALKIKPTDVSTLRAHPCSSLEINELGINIMRETRPIHTQFLSTTMMNSNSARNSTTTCITHSPLNANKMIFSTQILPKDQKKLEIASERITTTDMKRQATRISIDDDGYEKTTGKSNRRENDESGQTLSGNVNVPTEKNRREHHPLCTVPPLHLRACKPQSRNSFDSGTMALLYTYRYKLIQRFTAFRTTTLLSIAH